MSFSKNAPNCAFCNVGKGIYNCPRCSRRYCSTHCYKSPDHKNCSEQFYQEWVETTLREKSSDPSEKENMLRMLRRFEEGSSRVDEPSIEERLGNIDLERADENQIWDALNDQEKECFKTFISDDKNLETILIVKEPWWISRNLDLVVEMEPGAECRETISDRPSYPLATKLLSELTSVKPSNCIPYNLINLLYAYAFLVRLYNCDLRDFIDVVVDSMFTLCPVLVGGRNYSTLQESVQDSIRLLTAEGSNADISFVKSIIKDINKILLGPNNARPCTYTLCALHDVILLFSEHKCSGNDLTKDLRKKLGLSIKKIEYYMSWCLEFENDLKELASDLMLLMVPDLIPDSDLAEKQEPYSRPKVFIEEIE